MGITLSSFVSRLLNKKKNKAASRSAGTGQDAEGSYPLAALSKHIGELLEVHYIDFGLPQILEAKLYAPPNDNIFYISLDESDLNIVYWYNRHMDGRLSGVRMIKRGGNILYRNDTLPFDYDRAEHLEYHQGLRGPTRMMTREYLSGKFG